MKKALTFFLMLGLIGSAEAASSRTIKIDLGTSATEGSPWHEILLEMRQEWNRISDGRVRLRIYPGGVQGGEVEMLRKVRIGQLGAVALSSAGLSHIDKSVSSLQIPMMLETYDELDHVLEHMTPQIEARLLEKGFVVLNWGDVGFVRFFTKEPATIPDHIRPMKLFTVAGDPATEKLYKEFGFHPIPLALTDLLPSLQTGLVEAFDVPPLFALLGQSFALAGNMIDVRWAPLMGATVVRKKTWEKVPEEWRAPMLEAARRAGASRRDEIRKMDRDSIDEMAKRGLSIVTLDPESHAAWQEEAENAYPRIRGSLVPADLFDEVERLRDAYRASRAATEPTEP